MKRVNDNSPFGAEMKCLEDVQHQLEDVRALLQQEDCADEILKRIASIRFAVRSMESTLMEKEIKKQVSAAFDATNLTQQERILSAADLI
jgi:DNA-binding FrmR family transcriptional regulator